MSKDAKKMVVYEDSPEKINYLDGIAKRLAMEPVYNGEPIKISKENK